MPNATFRRFLGVARETGKGTLSAAVAQAATTLNVQGVSGAFAAGVKVTIYDGANTEVLSASAVSITNGSGTITVGATAHAHGAGCLVTTVGTAAGPTDYIPLTKFDPGDDITYLEDNAWRGSPGTPFNLVPGVRSASIDISGDVFADTVGYFVAGVLGDVTFTGGTPNQHAIALLTSGNGQPSTWQLTDVYLPGAPGGALVRQYGSCAFSEFTAKFTADGMHSYDAKATSYASGLVSLPTANFSTVVPFAAWQGLVTVAGTATPLLVDGQISIKRSSAEPIHNVNASQDPYAIWFGPALVDGNLSVVAEDETFLNYFLNNTQPSLDLNFTNGLSGASLLAVKYHLSKCAVKTGKPDAGKDWLQFALDYAGVMNTTDAGTSGGYSPCKVTLSNTKATGTYG